MTENTKPAEFVEGELIQAPKEDPIARKLVAGTGIGAAVAIILFELIRVSTGYTPGTEVAAAAQAIVSFLVGWVVKENI